MNALLRSQLSASRERSQRKATKREWAMPSLKSCAGLSIMQFQITSSLIKCIVKILISIIVADVVNNFPKLTGEKEQNNSLKNLYAAQLKRNRNVADYS